MIEADVTGNKQIQQLANSLDTCDEWNDWECEFIYTIATKNYKNITTKQRAIVTKLIDKLVKGDFR